MLTFAPPLPLPVFPPAPLYYTVVEIIYWCILVWGYFAEFTLKPNWTVFTPSPGRLVQYDMAELSDLIQTFDNVKHLNRISTLYVMLHGAARRTTRAT